jgi:hypothetical protein
MGGYAPVIRATDYPVPPASASRAGRTARPGSSERPPDDDVFVYRADHRGQDTREREAAYWYGLLSEPADQLEEPRGPFEPLQIPSDEPPWAARPPEATDYAERHRRAEEILEEPASAHERKLEQIKDFYLTAEAIGEDNVDKHFDQLLAHQRELISDYFRQSAAVRHTDGLPAQAGPNPFEPRQAGGRASSPEGSGVAAEPPHRW